MSTIAFIGLGIMGAPMAGHLIDAGHDVVGYNRSRPAVDRLVERGGRAAGSVADAVRDAEIVITMVPDSPDVEDVALGEDGIYAAAKPGTCIIASKTVIKGEITGDEDVIVEGNVEGQIRITRDLRVGANGVVKATVEAQSIIVSGELVGDCQASVRVEIQATGRLTGNIRAPKIVIAEGAMFRGNSDMSARKDDKKVAAL